ncbi:hypothetical protein Mkiyose1665_13460 [Mycobacterium kiyosense]|uniref:Uncharacterized protein n=1 Tax=Mycobacterium kiyosense TaxID=2871094 RepID=A0A9P3Q7V0_9MYCO|nr:hypothetical protein IWGMT90018_02520 [Mycobacterium kiyosense]BDE11660.1 hypothetical protein MKCMC460_05200 [Mycobacterium sp. 20KCMC460]GLB81938.1 hypothetical protein SRL2020028_11940 [Mycobacterium kiyosense]GLB88102.1 hypothetical protein SRL2020130_09190 [Mycobacterium kiyosense]GLB95662.1 hypothetical protein SRL2020226_24380 [Mycobacterium kiyosense]
MKTVGDQRIPPVREIAFGEGPEIVPRLGDWGMPRRELPDGRTEVTLLGGQPESHAPGPGITPGVKGLGFGRTGCYPFVLQDEPSRLVEHYGAPPDL